MMNTIKAVVWIIGLIPFLQAVYFLIVAFFGLPAHKKQLKFEPKHKFAVVIAARNEELVIGNLVDSLKKQKYPKELFKVFVIPNNCTDHTKQIALSRGAEVFDCTGIIKSKGDALREFFHHILKHDDVYDAFCIFDADNVVDENFLIEMNNAMCQGIKVGQGYRESKNPSDTVISSCSSIYYYLINRFYNQARSLLGISAMLNGSGFMVSAEIMRQQGGWHTETMTEDIEFTAKCLLAGEKIAWIPEAVFYDEQPLGFIQSWRQRKRWATGAIQLFEIYAAKLAKKAVSEKDISCFDLVMFALLPIMQIPCVISLIFTMLLTVWQAAGIHGHKADMFLPLVLTVAGSYFIGLLMALAAVIMARKKVFKMMKGISTFAVFMFLGIPISLFCLLKKESEWVPIKHTRVIKINELISEKE